MGDSQKKPNTAVGGCGTLFCGQDALKKEPISEGKKKAEVPVEFQDVLRRWKGKWKRVEEFTSKSRSALTSNSFRYKDIRDKCYGTSGDSGRGIVGLKKQLRRKQSLRLSALRVTSSNISLLFRAGALSGTSSSKERGKAKKKTPRVVALLGTR